MLKMNEGESVLEGFFPPNQKKKKKFRVLPSEKLTLNAKRVNSPAHSSPSTSQLCHCAPGFVAHWRQSTKLL